MTDFVVVRSHPSLLKFVDSLQRKNAEALSFYPMVTFEREAEKGRLFLGLLNGQPCGYIYVGANSMNVKCHQVCIQYDARRRLYGAHLVAAMEEYATQGQAHSITLRCGFDLDANLFWRELGYSCIKTVAGGVRRMRQINIWQKELQSGLFDLIHIEPAVGKTNATVWRKNKQTGVISSFHRGKKLKDYRMIVAGNDYNDIDSVE